MNIIFERLELLAEKIRDQQLIDSYRVFHGRGQIFPGLEFVTIDFFQPVILVTLFAEPPDSWLDDLLAKSQLLFEKGQTSLLVQRRYLAGAPSELCFGVLPEQASACRGNLQFSLHLAQQQNSGFFSGHGTGQGMA